MEGNKFPYQRIIVIGTTGSGKSTLAEKLAQQLELELIELDALHWLPGWQALPDQEFRTLVDIATRRPAWSIAGNYSTARDISWPRAQAVVWLDYPLWTIFWQLWFRTWRRWWSQELLWGTNRERLFSQFKLWSADESIFRWLFSTYWKRKREYPLLFGKPEYSHLQIFTMHNPQETEAWLKTISPGQVSSR
ncbi:MAG: AAA family ATPase [Chloroflexi bacterium]|nr:AAA family ATPase [Chloroflexota bacterium]